MKRTEDGTKEKKAVSLRVMKRVDIKKNILFGGQTD